jgi:hypothetical protein
MGLSCLLLTTIRPYHPVLARSKHPAACASAPDRQSVASQIKEVSLGRFMVVILGLSVGFRKCLIEITTPAEASRIAVALTVGASGRSSFLVSDDG